MNQEIALELLRRMVETPSVSGQERELATYLANMMERLGFQSHIDEVGNVVGERGRGDRPLIMLLGHMDTVPGFISVHQEGSLLYGRGTVDAKGALATFICAAAALDDPAFRLVVVGAVEEETPGSRGAHHLLDRYSPDIVFIGEPSGWSNVVLGYKGRIQLSYRVTRPASHSAGPGEMATEAGVAFWNQLVEHLAVLGDEKSVFYRPVPRLLRFEGSDQQANLEISCRIPPYFDLAAFQRFLDSISQGGEIHFGEVTPAAMMERTNPAAQALIGAIRRHDAHPKLKMKTGTSDMNIVSQRWQVPMVAYGPGDSTLDHTDNEHLDLDEYLHAIDVLTDALRALTGELIAPRIAAVERVGKQEEGQPLSETHSCGSTGREGQGERQEELPLSADPAYAPEEEEELAKRLQALGYLE